MSRFSELLANVRHGVCYSATSSWSRLVFVWRRRHQAEGTGPSVDESAADLISGKVIAPQRDWQGVQPQACVPQADSIEVLLGGGTRVRFSGSLAYETLRKIIVAVCAR